MSVELPYEWWGLAAAVVYAAIGYVVGEWYPFSGYNLYSGAAERTHGSVPVFFVDGIEARLTDWTAFEGIDPAAIHYEGIPCAHQWLVLEARRWVTENMARSPSESSHPIEWGYHHYRITPEGSVQFEFEPMVRGRAKKR